MPLSLEEILNRLGELTPLAETRAYQEQVAIDKPRDPAAYLLRYYLETIHHLELSAMAYTLEDFRHDTLRLLLKDTPQFTPDECEALLARMDIQDWLRSLPAEDRLRGLNAEDRLRGLDPEEVLKCYAPEDLLRQLDPAAITAWLKRTGH